MEEAARARVRCAWAKFKELSPILTARGAAYRIKGKIYKACVQSALTYGIETLAERGKMDVLKISDDDDELNCN